MLTSVEHLWEEEVMGRDLSSQSSCLGYTLGRAVPEPGPQRNYPRLGRA